MMPDFKLSIRHWSKILATLLPRTKGGIPKLDLLYQWGEWRPWFSWRPFSAIDRAVSQCDKGAVAGSQ
jgi:hypothetical protein